LNSVSINFQQKEEEEKKKKIFTLTQICISKATVKPSSAFSE
jgi:hypothetical protein